MLQILIIILLGEAIMFGLNGGSHPGYLPDDPCFKCGEDWEFNPPSE